MASRIVAAILATVGTLLLVVGMAAGVTRYEVLDSARFTATADQIRKDTDRDKILTAEEAKDYGIIDTVFDYRKLSAGN